jgi:hypothetical protein
MEHLPLLAEKKRYEELSGAEKLKVLQKLYLEQTGKKLMNVSSANEPEYMNPVGKAPGRYVRVRPYEGREALVMLPSENVDEIDGTPPENQTSETTAEEPSTDTVAKDTIQTQGIQTPTSPFSEINEPKPDVQNEPIPTTATGKENLPYQMFDNIGLGFNYGKAGEGQQMADEDKLELANTRWQVKPDIALTESGSADKIEDPKEKAETKEQSPNTEKFLSPEDIAKEIDAFEIKEGNSIVFHYADKDSKVKFIRIDGGSIIYKSFLNRKGTNEETASNEKSYDKDGESFKRELKDLLVNKDEKIISITITTADNSEKIDDGQTTEEVSPKEFTAEKLHIEDIANGSKRVKIEGMNSAGVTTTYTLHKGTRAGKPFYSIKTVNRVASGSIHHDSTDELLKYLNNDKLTNVVISSEEVVMLEPEKEKEVPDEPGPTPSLAGDQPVKPTPQAPSGTVPLSSLFPGGAVDFGTFKQATAKTEPATSLPGDRPVKPTPQAPSGTVTLSSMFPGGGVVDFKKEEGLYEKATLADIRLSSKNKSFFGKMSKFAQSIALKLYEGSGVSDLVAKFSIWNEQGGINAFEKIAVTRKEEIDEIELLSKALDQSRIAINSSIASLKAKGLSGAESLQIELRNIDNEKKKIETRKDRIKTKFDKAYNTAKVYSNDRDAIANRVIDRYNEKLAPIEEHLETLQEQRVKLEILTVASQEEYALKQEEIDSLVAERNNEVERLKNASKIVITGALKRLDGNINSIRESIKLGREKLEEEKVEINRQIAKAEERANPYRTRRNEFTRMKSPLIDINVPPISIEKDSRKLNDIGIRTGGVVDTSLQPEISVTPETPPDVKRYGKEWVSISSHIGGWNKYIEGIKDANINKDLFKIDIKGLYFNHPRITGDQLVRREAFLKGAGI